MKNKRGQGLSTNAIILIILGIVVLVFLILGFTIGWSRLLPFLSRQNVDSVVNGCVASCSSGSIYGFCTQVRELIPAEGDSIEATCKEFATNPDYEKYGIKDCPAITCPETPAEGEETPTEGT